MHILTPETTSMLSKSTGLSGEELEKEILDVVRASLPSYSFLSIVCLSERKDQELKASQIS